MHVEVQIGPSGSLGSWMEVDLDVHSVALSPRLWGFIVTLFVGNDIFVASMCIYCNTTIISNSFAMLMSSISSTQHHNLFIVCKKCTYIVYIVHIERNMHIASVFSVRPPFLMFGNICLRNGDPPSWLPTLYWHVLQLEPCIPPT